MVTNNFISSFNRFQTIKAGRNVEKTYSYVHKLKSILISQVWK